MQQKQKTAHLLQAAAPNTAVGGGKSDATCIQTDFFQKHLAKIKQKLQSATGEYRKALMKEMERTVQKERQFKSKTSVDLQQKLVREEELRLKMMHAIMQKLASIGKCPADFAWRWEPPKFHCAGGSHWATPEELGVSAGDCNKYFADTGVMKLD
jgi:hypothetical protein